MVKNLLAMQNTWVQSLGWEESLVKGMATYSSSFAWRIPWTEEPSRLYSPWGHTEPDTTEQLTHTILYIYVSKITCSCVFIYVGFPGALEGKTSACNAGDQGSIPELGRSPGEGKGYPL